MDKTYVSDHLYAYIKDWVNELPQTVLRGYTAKQRQKQRAAEAGGDVEREMRKSVEKFRRGGISFSTNAYA